MSQSVVFHHACRVMGTRFAIVLPGVDGSTGEALAEMAERHLRAQERLMSRFDAHSPVSDLNRRAADEPVTPPPALWEILLLCRRHWRRSRGAFDITQGPLCELWRESLARNETPSPEALAETRAHTGFERIRLNEAARTVRFEVPGVCLDLGGFGKGYALDQLAKLLSEQGVGRAFLSFGESSVTVIGSHPAGLPWPVAIADLFQPAVSVRTFNLQDASISTSGTAPFNQRGGLQPFGHILNPRDGRPITGYRTLSATSPSATDAEVLSTALLVTPVNERPDVLSSYPGASGVEIVYEPRDDGFASRIAWHHES